MRLASLAVVTLLASACASVPMATPEADRLAKEFKTTPAKANLYVFRDELFGGAVKMSVLLDGRILGDTVKSTFLFTPVEPGKHTLVSKTENDSTLEIDAKAGQNVFVWQEVKMGIWAARSDLQLVPEADAKPRVEQCSLSLTQAPPPAAAAPSQPPAVPRS
jgi:hypothetical protein